MKHPNIVFVFADQMRAQSVGYAGDPNVISPNLDKLARENVSFSNAVSCCPLCTPYRASLLTGKYPLSTGVFMNDVRLSTDEISIAHAVKQHGYDTAYIGKWHLDGPAHRCFTPPGPRRQGFDDFWAVHNMGHAYFNGFYYRDTSEMLKWNGYEPEAQTDLAIDYIKSYDKPNPFCLFISYGTPHSPYLEVPERYLKMYSLQTLIDRPNFLTPFLRKRKNMEEYQKRYPIEATRKSSVNIYRGVVPDMEREHIMGYNAHITALDEYVGRLLSVLEENGIAENTIFVFTSDHGDMLGSQRKFEKQWPHDESIMVPFLMRYPKKLTTPLNVDTPINVVDVMPTLLGLAGLPIPESVEGKDLSHCALGEKREDDPQAALIMAVSPFLSGPSWGMREYRGVRTQHYTYTRSFEGAWHLFDNQEDPYQLKNRVNDPKYADVQKKLDATLADFLLKTNDDFSPAKVHRERIGIYVVKDDDAVPTS